MTQVKSKKTKYTNKVEEQIGPVLRMSTFAAT